MSDSNMSFTRKANISRIIVLVGLLALLSIYFFIHIQNGEDVLLRSVISAMPLAIFIPGLLSRRYRTGSLLCFVLLIYFMLTTQQLFIPGDQIIDWIIMCLIVFLFTVSMFYARWQQRADVFEGEITHGG